MAKSKLAVDREILTNLVRAQEDWLQGRRTTKSFGESLCGWSSRLLYLADLGLRSLEAECIQPPAQPQRGEGAG